MTRGTGLKWRPARTLDHDLWIIAAPYCSGGEVLAEALLSWKLAHRVDVENLNQLHAFRPWITEANATVQSHLAPHTYLERHAARVREILRPVIKALSRYDLFLHGPLGQTVLHPYVCKAIAPKARMIWISRKRKAWFNAIEALECTNPISYPEHVGWAQDRAGREALLWDRRRIERRKFLRLAKAFPQDCLDIRSDDENMLDTLRAFAQQHAAYRAT